MATIDIYSKRLKSLRRDAPDLYAYDKLPEPLRNQIIHIWHDALGNHDQLWAGEVNEAYSAIVNTLCREYGITNLPGGSRHGRNRDYLEEITNFFLHEQDVDKLLDVVELSFYVIDQATRDWRYLHRKGASELADAAIEELNDRFKEHGVGYYFSDGKIIRVDSELIHSEVVKPVLGLLKQAMYAGAQQEFLRAHEHYRDGNSKEVLNECLKAFESLMKSICNKRCWHYAPNATAKNLIQICLEKDLIPAFWQENFTSLRILLESSVPTGRNKLGGHGQGATITEVPIHLVAYMLHMTASTLVFLGEAEVALP